MFECASCWPAVVPSAWFPPFVIGELSLRNGAVRHRLPEPAASGRFDAQPLPGAQRARDLAWQWLAVERVAPGRSRLAPGGAPRGVPAALGDQREGHLLQRLQLADHAVAAARVPGAAGAAPARVLHDAQRE